MRSPSAAALVWLLAVLGAASCSNPLGRQYEYEEQLYLSVDGHASVIVNASIPALVALRGMPLDPSPALRPDRNAVRTMLEGMGCEVDGVGQPWTRRGRRFIQMRISSTDVRTLSRCRLLSWSAYALDPQGETTLLYTQKVGPPTPGAPGAVNWDGTEIVGFKLHLPSRVLDHNVKRLADGSNGEIERGNILSYEQRLTDRRAGVPVEMRVLMGAESILAQTLMIFAGAAAAALAAIAIVIWLTMRRARRRQQMGAA
jgi:hypothetical protein